MGKITSYKKVDSLLSLLLVLAMLFCLCSCGKDNDSKDKSDKKSTSATASKEDKTSDDKTEETEDEINNTAGDKINLDALDEIESKDTCNVKITKKEIKKDEISGLSLKGNDALIFTLSNSGSKDVSGIKIYLVAYDENNGLTELQLTTSFSIGALPFVKVINSADTTIKAGSSEEIAVQVDAEKFVGVKAIVASYTTSDGQEYENDVAEEWIEKYQLGKNYTLD